MLLGRFPTFLADDLKVLRFVRVAIHAYNHLRVFVQALVFENISPHPTVSSEQRLSLGIARQHSGHHNICAGKRIAVGRAEGDSSYQQKEHAKDRFIFHSQNWNTSLPRYSRHASLKNSPKRLLSSTFCTSRGLK